MEKPSASELETPVDVSSPDVEVTTSVHSAEPCFEQERGASFYEDKSGQSQCVTESDENIWGSENDLMSEHQDVSDDRDRETRNGKWLIVMPNLAACVYISTRSSLVI